ncbi:substrate-binding domain-containing protein [Nonomuraea sp. SMC257]|uniref:Substrate-binding domain-containing protein n=1 Tax=Nonomuraea montanisoli TaxID=2741721 RepID=A0A7Y6M0Z2_9ACTN|nr:substrate-binding domain-containing protein [Nonomuraea montanisoli]NUW29885.1 substrate-binding domain-containing protein [Nonomuraea montanisoli]
MTAHDHPRPGAPAPEAPDPGALDPGALDPGAPLARSSRGPDDPAPGERHAQAVELLPDERRAQVVELLRRRGVVRVNELAAELDVSVITVRRDIALLSSQGLLRRVRGGAVLHGGAVADTLPGVTPQRTPPVPEPGQETGPASVPSLAGSGAGPADAVSATGTGLVPGAGPVGVPATGTGLVPGAGPVGVPAATGHSRTADASAATRHPGIAAAPPLPGRPGTGGQPGAGGWAGVPDQEAAQATIGMVVPSLDYYWPDVIRGAREAAAASGARLVLRGATYQAADERRQLSRLVETAGVDGLLVAPTTTGDEGEELVRWLQGAGVPVVLVERAATVGPHQEAMESVVSDHVFGAAMAVRHLATLGHRRVGVITTTQSPTAPHVRRGWRQACVELGLPLDGVPDLTTVDQRDPGWPEALDGVLDVCVASGTTALLVHSDPEAISLVERCQERGIRVPGDLSVVTYDDEVAELCDPPLTAVRPPKAAIGRAAYRLLAERLADEDPQRPTHRVVIEPRLIVRASSAPPSPRPA